MQQDWINALIGGAIIGTAVSLMLIWTGRVTGISGILNGVLSPLRGDANWRILFILGLILGGLFLKLIKPEVFAGELKTENWTVVVAGLLVGFGTILGSGCTSGHGVCGISRMSLRSVVATITFIMAGVFSVVLFRYLGVNI